MRVVVVTGMSGSGKSHALQALEDAGYYPIDNLPIALLHELLKLFQAEGEVKKLALVLDARMHTGMDRVPSELALARADGHEVSLLFLNASDRSLSRRYSETRRVHPLSPDGSVSAGILRERELLNELAHSCTDLVDTTEMSVHDLKRRVLQLFSGEEQRLAVMVKSFGFKHGSPTNADLVVDVRFLANPYFVEALRTHTGEDADVADYVLTQADTQEFLRRYLALLEFLLPRYEAEGKAYLTVAVGCTGGRHRSVALANEFGAWVGKQGYPVQVSHRDIHR